MEIKQHNEFSRINEFNTSQTNDNLKTLVHYYWGMINEAIVRITQLNVNLQQQKREREKN